jgi:hypothetical protein
MSIRITTNPFNDSGSRRLVRGALSAFRSQLGDIDMALASRAWPLRSVVYEPDLIAATVTPTLAASAGFLQATRALPMRLVPVTR